MRCVEVLLGGKSDSRNGDPPQRNRQVSKNTPFGGIPNLQKYQTHSPRYHGRQQAGNLLFPCPGRVRHLFAVRDGPGDLQAAVAARTESILTIWHLWNLEKLPAFSQPPRSTGQLASWLAAVIAALLSTHDLPRRSKGSKRLSLCHFYAPLGPPLTAPKVNPSANSSNIGRFGGGKNLTIAITQRPPDQQRFGL